MKKILVVDDEPHRPEHDQRGLESVLLNWNLMAFNGNEC